MKKIILCAILCAGLVACEDDKKTPQAPGTVQKNMLVQTVKRSGANFGTVLTTNWQYNGVKLLTAFDSNGNYRDYTYEGNNIKKIETYLSTGLLVNTEVFFYDASNKLTVSQLLAGTTGMRHQYTNNSDGTISVVTTVGNAQTQTEALSTATIAFQDGEVSRVDVFYDGDVSESFVYEYDDKLKPTVNALGFDRIAYAMTAQIERKGIAHNVISEVHTSIADDVTTATRTFTYGGDSFPTSMLNTEPGNTFKIEYGYELREFPVEN